MNEAGRYKGWINVNFKSHILYLFFFLSLSSTFTDCGGVSSRSLRPLQISILGLHFFYMRQPMDHIYVWELRATARQQKCHSDLHAFTYTLYLIYLYQNTLHSFSPSKKKNIYIYLYLFIYNTIRSLFLRMRRIQSPTGMSVFE